MKQIGSDVVTSPLITGRVGAPLGVKVWGEFACFTRPEFKVERVTYPVMTPSSARGLLEAIFWKPQFSWQVREIRVLQPIRYVSILRNEVNSVASRDAASGWAMSGGGYVASADRAQRHTLALRDVGYVIVADVEVRSGVDEDPAKYRDQFRRRVRSGRCFQTPYLGCREFAAYFTEIDGTERAIDVTEDLGPMLLGIDYEEGSGGRGRPRFFQSRLERGVLHVPLGEVT